jgi:hypothetical protein
MIEDFRYNIAIIYTLILYERKMKQKNIGDASKLSTKALKRIIKDNQDIKEFQEALLSRIKEYNQHARTFERPEEHRR